MVTQAEAVKLMCKLARLVDKRLKIESKAASIIAELSLIKQAGGHDIKVFVEKQGFKRYPLTGVEEDENKRNDKVLGEFESDL